VDWHFVCVSESMMREQQFWSAAQSVVVPLDPEVPLVPLDPLLPPFAQAGREQAPEQLAKSAKHVWQSALTVQLARHVESVQMQEFRHV
jgi:hypothetical protein